jgi:glutamate-5-semialdehyde dehydrogenase
MTSTLTELTAGMPIPYGGDRIAVVDEKLARAFRPGDALYVVQQTGALLHVPSDVRRAVTRQVDAAVEAFTALRAVPPAAVGAFFDEFASRLEEGWERIERANEADVARARERGRSTTRLEVSGRVREEMTAGLRGWARRVGGEGPAALSRPVGRISHDGWDVTEVTAPLGVVAFVFEGRPNVLADAAGVVATGNTAVLRIGGDALGTAEAIRDLALAPALRASGLPEGTIGIVPVRDRSAGWALFSDPRLALAVTRGTGRAVMELSAVARQAGVPVSAHGTGGAWLVADAAADAARFSGAVEHSLDRKVCNTLNVAVVVRERAAELVPVLLEAADRAAASRAGVGARARIHVAEGSQQWVGAGEFATSIAVRRAQGDVTEPRADVLAVDGLSREWEWEGTPELALLVVAGLDEAITAVNRWSPQFVASLISEDPAAQERFRQSVNAPFVGDGFTRWVDGQYALDEPELGLSNWQSGRLLARGGVLTGATMTTRRLFAHQGSGDQHR